MGSWLDSNWCCVAWTFNLSWANDLNWILIWLLLYARTGLASLQGFIASVCQIHRHNPYLLFTVFAHLHHSSSQSFFSSSHWGSQSSTSKSFFSQSFCLCTTQIHNPCHIHSHFVQNICFVAVFLAYLSLIFIPILKSIFANFIILVLTVFVSSALLLILCYSRCKGSPPQGSSSEFTITESFN